MGKKCPKCGYERQLNDIVPDSECPSCGVIYHKFLATSKKLQSVKQKEPESFQILDEKILDDSDSIGTFVNLKNFVIVIVFLSAGFYFFQTHFSKNNTELILKDNKGYDVSKFKYDIRGMYKGSGVAKETGWGFTLLIGDDYKIHRIKWTKLKTNYTQAVVSWSYPSSFSYSKSIHKKNEWNSLITIEGQNLKISTTTPNGRYELFDLSYEYQRPIRNEIIGTRSFHKAKQSSIACSFVVTIPSISSSEPISKENVDIQHNSWGEKELVDTCNDIYKLWRYEDRYDIDGNKIFINAYKQIPLAQIDKATFIQIKYHDRNESLLSPADLLNLFNHPDFIARFYDIRKTKLPFEINNLSLKNQLIPNTGAYLRLTFGNMCMQRNLGSEDITISEQQAGTKSRTDYSQRDTFYSIDTLDKKKFEVEIIFREDGTKYALNKNYKVKKHIDPKTKKEIPTYLRYELEKQ